MDELIRLARELGLRIEEASLDERLGDYCHATGTVRLQRGMSVRVRRSVLAHEIGHAVYGDSPSKFGPIRMRQERRADEWAARHLIEVKDYALAERLRDGHISSMAFDLNVIQELVIAFQRLIIRERAAL